MKATFGQTLRAYRLGFRKLLGYEAWLRIGLHSHNPVNWIVDVCPWGVLPVAKSGEHVCWWEGSEDDHRVLRDVVLPLLPRGAWTEQMTFVLDDDGKRVT